MTMLEWLITTAAWARPRKCATSSSTPTTNMKSSTPTWLSICSVASDSRGRASR